MSVWVTYRIGTLPYRVPMINDARAKGNRQGRLLTRSSSAVQVDVASLSSVSVSARGSPMTLVTLPLIVATKAPAAP